AIWALQPPCVAFSALSSTLSAAVLCPPRALCPLEPHDRFLSYLPSSVFIELPPRLLSVFIAMVCCLFNLCGFHGYSI
ncbi:hypothetical protein DENSPDRAFT_846478, partial [Dentipellis sp. KUC8613]